MIVDVIVVGWVLAHSVKVLVVVRIVVDRNTGLTAKDNNVRVSTASTLTVSVSTTVSVRMITVEVKVSITNVEVTDAVTGRVVDRVSTVLDVPIKLTRLVVMVVTVSARVLVVNVVVKKTVDVMVWTVKVSAYCTVTAVKVWVCRVDTVWVWVDVVGSVVLAV